ncbi:diacylglycerol kinase family lipid kinase [Exiguobacterium sp. MER 193]|uniref:diacylglycerol/lipid kinase family protein n=1 Tax=unclassified Exiguobacterium TaxID=2644629 RepID=UPI001BE966A7|nr:MULTISPECIES: diacylglycerol kinase family protein [unclassified Exiguobacterium]MCM3279620.1 diacylglycerol kinase family lipid kinase [Exiguobacterium sp. MER 193]
METVMLIVNPSSGKELGEQHATHAEEVLRERYGHVDVRFTEKEQDATNFAREAAEKHYQAVIAMGGDGTLNEAVTGLAEATHRPDFGIIPLGTVNDLARALGVPSDPKQAIEALRDAEPTPMDIGTYENGYFMNVIAIGLIAEAVDEVSVEEKTKWGPFAYLIEGVKAFREHSPYELALDSKDGEFDGEAYLVVIALTNSVGGFENFEPDARLNDGLLHVYIFEELGLKDALQLTPALFTGKLKETDSVTSFCTKRVKVTSPEALPVNADGDTGGTLPLTFEVLPSHLNVLKPV